MKITEDVRKFAAEQGIAEEAVIKRGLEQNGASGLSDIEGKAAREAANERGQRVSLKAREFTEAGAEIYSKT